MKKRSIPFYGEMKKGRRPFTILVDLDTQKIYRANHKEVGELVYYGPIFVLILFLFNYIKNLSVAITLLLMGGIIIGLISGNFFYRKTLKELREINIGEHTLRAYLSEGKKQLKYELLLNIGILVCTIILSILYVVFTSFIWLFLVIFFSFLLGGTTGPLSIKRYRFIYKNEMFIDEGVS